MFIMIQFILIGIASIVSIVPFLGPYLSAALVNAAGELNPDIHQPINAKWVRAELKKEARHDS